MRIHIQTQKGRLFSIQPDNELTIKIYNILIDKLHCHVTELISKSSDSFGLIKAKLPLNKSLKDVVNTLHGFFGGYILQLSDNFLITDKEDELYPTLP